MRQLVSQLVSFLLSPLLWIVLLVILRYFLNRPGLRRKCSWAAVIIFLVFSNQFLLESYARYWQPPPKDLNVDSAYSCGILLGGFGSPDARDNSGYFNQNADRFIQALKLYKLGKIRTVLVNGGNGKQDVSQFNEAAWTRNQLQIMGVPDSVVLFEDQSANTADNAANARKLLDSARLKPPYVLITSAFHMPRASLIYKNAGLPHVAFPCNYTVGKGKFSFWDLVPDPNIIHEWNPFLKEAVGYWIYRVKG